MDYPRQIHLNEETENRLVAYIENELVIHYAERGEWNQDLIDTQTDYFATPSTTKKTFPFTGAANIVIPIMAIVVESLHAKAMTQLFALKNEFVSTKVPGQFDDISWGLSQYNNYELLENGADMYRFADNALMENYKFGSMVGKAGYEKIVKTAVRQVGDQENEFEVVTRQGATADNVPLANFIMPFYCQDPQTAPWCGEEHLEPAYEVKKLCDSKFFYDDTWEKLENWVREFNSQELTSAQYTQTVENLQKQQVTWPNRVGWVELWMGWDVDDSGKEKEIVVHYHRLSRTVLSIRYNWYDDLRRPYRTGKMINVENRWPGLGVGKQTKMFQREITIQHRQRLDNATIANIRMFKVNKLAGYGPGEPLFPGKLWFVDSMDDIEAFQAGEIYPSSFNDEIQTLNYAQQRSGINDLNLGMPQAGTPGTASSDMARLQEGNKKNDYVMENNKRFFNQIQRDVLYNVFQFGTRDVQIFNFIPNGDKVRAFVMNAPLALVREQLIMNTHLIGMSDNKLSDRSNWTQIAGFISQYYTQLMQFAMETKNVALMGLLSKYIPQGSTEVMKQILESFDTRVLERIIPMELTQGYLPDLGNNPMIAGALGSGDPNATNGTSQPGGDTSAQGTIPSSGMGLPPQAG